MKRTAGQVIAAAYDALMTDRKIPWQISDTKKPVTFVPDHNNVQHVEMHVERVASRDLSVTITVRAHYNSKYVTKAFNAVVASTDKKEERQNGKRQHRTC